MLFRMTTSMTVMLAVLATGLPALAGYTSAQRLLDEMFAAERARAEGVSNYAMDITLMNQASTQYYERTSVQANGQTITAFQIVPLAGLGGGFSDAKVPKGMATAISSADSDQMAKFVQHAEIVGRESIDGKKAYLIKADGVNLRQKADGQDFLIRTISMWVDVNDLVLLKTHMEGVIEQDGQSREMFIEKLDRDHRQVPGSRMILPYKTILRMGGLMGPEQQKEMKQARKQLADLDRQMKSMPESQKKMMESMMGSQLETLRKMVDGEAMEFEMTVREIRINAGRSGARAGAAKVTPVATMLASNMRANAPESAASTAQSEESLQQAREACIQEKVAKARAAKKKKKRLGKLFGAVGRIVKRHAVGDMAADVRRVSRDVYTASATSRDLKTAADALGITTDDLAECENPASSR